MYPLISHVGIVHVSVHVSKSSPFAPSSHASNHILSAPSSPAPFDVWTTPSPHVVGAHVVTLHVTLSRSGWLGSHHSWIPSPFGPHELVEFWITPSPQYVGVHAYTPAGIFPSFGQKHVLSPSIPSSHASSPVFVVPKLHAPFGSCIVPSPQKVSVHAFVHNVASARSHSSAAVSLLSNDFVPSFVRSPHRFSSAVHVLLSAHPEFDSHIHEYPPLASGPVNEPAFNALFTSHRSVLMSVTLF